MSTEHLLFPGSSGERLAARLEYPEDSTPRAYALFAHCFTCSKNLKAIVHISRALCDRGIAVLRFDFTGLGESEGDFADTTFSSNVEDLVAAARFLADDYQAPRLLIGHSLGGAAVLQAAARLPEVRGVVTVGAPADPEHVKKHLVGSLDELERRGELEFELPGRRFRVKREFVLDLERQRMEGVIGSLDRPILICHSPVDAVVGVENAAAIYTAAKHPKSFLSLDDADHLLTRERDSRYVAAMTATWASRYLDPDN